MGWTDFFLAGAIIIGAVYLLYRSLWKKQGYCPGCNGCSCNGGNDPPSTLKENQNGPTD
jgi:hypothetical protein